MLKIGKVYKFVGDYWYIASVRRYKKLLYTIRKVNANGSLGLTREVPFKRGVFRLAKNVQVKITVRLPREERLSILYNTLLKDTQRLVLEYATPERRKEGFDYERTIAQYAISAVGHYESEKLELVNLKTFAKALGFKNARRLYGWVADYYETQFTEHKYQNMDSISDATIMHTIESYKNCYHLLHGFSKKVSALLEKDFKAYLKELTKRGLSMGDITLKKYQ